jgi:hypothetical protein
MYPKRTFNFRLSQFSFTVALIIYSIGILGVDAHFDSSVHLPFKSSLFSFHSAILEIFLSTILVLQSAYINEEENKKHKENYRTPDEIRDADEAKEIREFYKNKKG